MLTNMGRTTTDWTSFADVTVSEYNFTNTTIMSTTDSPDDYFSQPAPVILHLIQKLVCIFSLVSNILVIMVVLRYRRPHTTANLLIINLAVAQIMLLAVRLPVLNLVGQNHTMAVSGCKMWKGVMQWSQAATAVTICMLSLERRRATKSLSRSSNVPQRRLAAGIALLWILTLGLSLPMFMRGYVPGFCYFTELSDVYFVVYEHIFHSLFYLLPLLIMSFAYGCVIRSLRYPSNGRSLQANQMQRIIATRRRVSLTVFIIAASFCILWVPYVFLQIVWKLHGIYIDRNCIIYIVILSETLIELQGCVNVLTLVVLSHSFRQGLMRYLCCVYECASKRRCCCSNSADNCVYNGNGDEPAPAMLTDTKYTQMQSNIDNRATRDTNTASSHV